MPELEIAIQIVRLAVEILIGSGVVWQIIIAHGSRDKMNQVIHNTNGIQQKLSEGDQAIGEVRGRKMERDHDGER
jgi:hypothetical protein